MKDGDKKVKNAVLFDSQSTDHLFSNRNFVDKVRNVKSGIIGRSGKRYRRFEDSRMQFR